MVHHAVRPRGPSLPTVVECSDRYDEAPGFAVVTQDSVRIDGRFIGWCLEYRVRWIPSIEADRRRHGCRDRLHVRFIAAPNRREAVETLQRRLAGAAQAIELYAVTAPEEHDERQRSA